MLRTQLWSDIPESARLIIERIERRAARLRKRITDILLLGTLRSQSTNEELLGEVDLRAVTDEVVERVGRKAEDRHVSLDLRIAPTTAFGDRTQIVVLLSNLVSNAISYSREGGRVTVAAEEMGDEVRVSVADDGIGIRSEVLPRIFDDYFRTKEAAEMNKMSTGLGLAIVKEIAGRFGMRIKVSSEEGSGTTFRVAIPKDRRTRFAQRRTTESGQDNNY